MKHEINMTTNFAIVTIFCFYINCSTNALKKPIAEFVNVHIGVSETGVFDLSEILPFDWDTLFVFSSNLNCEQTLKILGKENVECHDGCPRYYFLKRGKVIKIEILIPFFDEPDDDMVLFLHDSSGYNIWSKHDALFEYDYVQTKGGKIISLRHID